MYKLPETALASLVMAAALALAATLLLGACAPEKAEEKPAPASEQGASPLAAYDGSRVGHYGYGSEATAEQIAGWDIDVRPDGLGLPEGSGSVEDGEFLYEEKCAHCHGTFGEGAGRHPVLAGGQGSLRDDRPNKTVGSYWGHTSTLYDYIYRAMPFTEPESLSPDETYALTAYVLYLNDLVEDDFVLSQENFNTITLPNHGNFTPDPRPDTNNTRCMENCRDPGGITITSEVESVPIEVETTDSAQADIAHEEENPGQAVYQQYCSICHAAGVAGAPRVGDSDAWQARLEKGLAMVIKTAIEGTSSENGVMPPKGGFAQLSDDEVGEAVKHMVEASQ